MDQKAKNGWLGFAAFAIPVILLGVWLSGSDTSDFSTPTDIAAEGCARSEVAATGRAVTDTVSELVSGSTFSVVVFTDQGQKKCDVTVLDADKASCRTQCK